MEYYPFPILLRTLKLEAAFDENEMSIYFLERIESQLQPHKIIWKWLELMPVCNIYCLIFFFDIGKGKMKCVESQFQILKEIWKFWLFTENYRESKF